MKATITKLDDSEFWAKKISFSDRILGNFSGMWIFYIIIFFGSIIISSFINALIIILILLIWNIAEFYSWSKYQLIHIVLSEGKLKVEYLQKDLSKTVEDERGKFFFEKKVVWYKRVKTMYLIIHHNDEVLLKQYPIADVDEALFNALIERFS